MLHRERLARLPIEVRALVQNNVQHCWVNWRNLWAGPAENETMNRWTARDFQVAANLIDQGVDDERVRNKISTDRTLQAVMAHDRRLKREMLPMSPWVKRGVHIQR
jgi:uncharacterized protein (DUF608 family)